MGISKGEEFSKRDIYVNYSFEDAMFRWDHEEEIIYVKFYNKNESLEPVPHDNRLFNDALLYGEEITKEEYENQQFGDKTQQFTSNLLNHKNNNIEEGRKSLSYLVEKYLDDSELIENLKSSIYADPPRVPVRGVFDEISKNKKENISIEREDKELLDDLFHYFG